MLFFNAMIEEGMIHYYMITGLQKTKQAFNINIGGIFCVYNVGKTCIKAHAMQSNAVKIT